MRERTITIELTGDTETFQKLLDILKEAAQATDGVTAEEAVWDLHDKIDAAAAEA